MDLAWCGLLSYSGRAPATSDDASSSSFCANNALAAQAEENVAGSRPDVCETKKVGWAWSCLSSLYEFLQSGTGRASTHTATTRGLLEICKETALGNNLGNDRASEAGDMRTYSDLRSSFQQGAHSTTGTGIDVTG